jgi:hypothetical protein
MFMLFSQLMQSNFGKLSTENVLKVVVLISGYGRSAWLRNVKTLNQT